LESDPIPLTYRFWFSPRLVNINLLDLPSPTPHVRTPVPPLLYQTNHHHHHPHFAVITTITVFHCISTSTRQYRFIANIVIPSFPIRHVPYYIYTYTTSSSRLSKSLPSVRPFLATCLFHFFRISLSRTHCLLHISLLLYTQALICCICM
jgi:hypothetical protein